MGRTMTLHLSKISQILLSKDHPIKASVGGFDDFDSMKSEHSVREMESVSKYGIIKSNRFSLSIR